MYLLFDLETTGLLRPDIANIKHQPRAIEIYGLYLDENLKKAGSFEKLINPEIRIPPKITKLTGISYKDIKEAETFKQQIEYFIGQFEYCDQIVAHNAYFDISVLKHEFARHGRTEFEEILEERSVICTIEHTEFLFGKRAKMSDLYTYCTGKKPPKIMHRAKADVNMLAECFIYLCEKGIV